MCRMISRLAVANYRSLRDLVIPMRQLTVVSGDNGAGKSNLYRALRLLADTAYGGVSMALAREGGLASVLWAGLNPKCRSTVAPTSLRLGYATETLGYCIDLGYPSPANSAFDYDPEIKSEYIWSGAHPRPNAALVDRHGQIVRVRYAPGGDNETVIRIPPYDSILTHVADPERAPEIFKIREFMRSWRFYDHFRVDSTSPIREPHLATRTPVLSNDGRDLASALQTIREVGDAAALSQTIEDAFPGTSLCITPLDRHLTFSLKQPGLSRPLSAAELSDGTLRYILWTAALLTPRPAALTVLNEPETSLHPDLLPSLARLIVKASAHSQLWVVSHSSHLISALQGEDCAAIRLVKTMNETTVVGQDLLDRPSWHWPQR